MTHFTMLRIPDRTREETKGCGVGHSELSLLKQRPNSYTKSLLLSGKMHNVEWTCLDFRIITFIIWVCYSGYSCFWLANLPGAVTVDHSLCEKDKWKLSLSPGPFGILMPLSNKAMKRITVWWILDIK